MAIVTALNLGTGLTGIPAGAPPLGCFQCPVTSGLVGLYALGDGAGVAAKNFAGTGDPTLVGSAIWLSGYAELSLAGGYLETNIAETAAMTFLAVYKRKVTATNIGVIGNYLSGTSVGCSLYAQSTDAYIRANTDRGATSSSTSLVANVDAWVLASLNSPATGAFTLSNHTAGTSGQSSSVLDRVVESAGTIKVGAFTSTGWAAVTQMALGVVYNRSLTALELASVAAWARSLVSVYGITV